jgi:hypothetical protein
VRREGAAVLLCGCHATPLPDDIRSAQALEASHDLVGALARYRAIWTECERTKEHRPHDDCALAAVREAQIEKQLKQFKDAYTSWRRAAALSVSPRTTARALTSAATLAASELHDERTAREVACRGAKHVARMRAVSAAAIALSGLQKQYADKVVLDGIDLRVGAGECFPAGDEL